MISFRQKEKWSQMEIEIYTNQRRVSELDEIGKYTKLLAFLLFTILKDNWKFKQNNRIEWAIYNICRSKNIWQQICKGQKGINENSTGRNFSRWWKLQFCFSLRFGRSQDLDCCMPFYRSGLCLSVVSPSIVLSERLS
jgi:hypothetical protein